MKDYLYYQRLQIVADLWGKLYLFHHKALDENFPIAQLFFDTLPEISANLSSQEFVEVLNHCLFSPLDDPRTFAQIAADPPISSSSEILFGKLTERLGYLQISHSDVFKKRSFFQMVWQNIQKMVGISTLVVDLRWQAPGNVHPEVVSAFFGLFTPQPAYLKFSCRVHSGWEECGKKYIYQQRKETYDRAQISPIHTNFDIRRHYPIPSEVHPLETAVVFLINNTSFLHLWDDLAALQTLSHVHVIWEKTGIFSIPAPRKIFYPENIEVHLQSHFIEELPTITRTQTISNEELLHLDDMLSGIAKPTQQQTRIHLPKPDYPLETYVQKLLGLCKIWIAAKYFFYDETKTKEAWDEKLLQSIQRLEKNSSCMDEYRLIVSWFLTHLQDSHALLYPTKNPALYQKPYGFLPIALRYIEGKIIVVETQTNLLQKGDQITHLDGKSVEELEDYWRNYIPASSEQAFYRDFCHYLAIGEKNKKIPLRTKEHSQPILLEYSQREQIQSPQNTNLDSNIAEYYLQKVGDNFAYIKICEIASQAMYEKVLALAVDAKGIILELRAYSDVSPAPLIRSLCDKPVSSAEFRVPVISQMAKNWAFFQETFHPAQKLTQPVIALIDETTQSAAEDICVYLHHTQRVKFVGSPTAGCHGNVCAVYLSKTEKIWITPMQTTYSRGKLQNVGIIPDILVAPTVNSIKQGRDEVLQSAIELLRKESNGQ